MSELLNGIFECLDINSGTGLATEDNLQSMTSFQRLFYTRRLRNATSRMNTAFFCYEKQITPHWIWYNRVD